MAEGWARALKADSIEPYSAGVAPHGVDPRAIQAMAEAGVDIAGQRSKHVRDLMHIPFDFVVTVCDAAAESCPVFPGSVKRVHRSFGDPPRLARASRSDQEALEHYRRVRDEIRDFVASLPESLPGACP